MKWTLFWLEFLILKIKKHNTCTWYLNSEKNCFKIYEHFEVKIDLWVFSPITETELKKYILS